MDTTPPALQQVPVTQPKQPEIRDCEDFSFVRHLVAKEAYDAVPSATTLTVTQPLGTTNGGPIRRKGTSSSTKGGHGKRVTHFVFTLNNWTSDEYEQIKTIPCRWLIMGRETGEQGTPHLQGAVVLQSQKAYSRLTTLPGLKRAHVAEMHGTPLQSQVYCTKQDSAAYEKGTLPSPGKRVDLDDIIDQIYDGSCMRVLANHRPNAKSIVRYNRGLIALRALIQPVRQGPPTIFWFHGPTGCNKTRLAIDIGVHFGGGEFPWISSGSLKWFDGFDGHRVAVLDDLRAKHVEFAFLLRLLDRYPVQVEFKGGHVPFCPSLIIITAPYDPRRMWSLRTEEQLDQLVRRVTRIVEFPICSADIEYVSSYLRERGGTIPIPDLQYLHLVDDKSGGKVPILSKTDGLHTGTSMPVTFLGSVDGGIEQQLFPGGDDNTEYYKSKVDLSTSRETKRTVTLDPPRGTLGGGLYREPQLSSDSGRPVSRGYPNDSGETGTTAPESILWNLWDSSSEPDLPATPDSPYSIFHSTYPCGSSSE